jgi:hypothetical protein
VVLLLGKTPDGGNQLKRVGPPIDRAKAGGFAYPSGERDVVADH